MALVDGMRVLIHTVRAYMLRYSLVIILGARLAFFCINYETAHFCTFDGACFMHQHIITVTILIIPVLFSAL